MNIFNSLGSNYKLNFVIKTFLADNSDRADQKLINFLEKKYNGKALLFYKGREAIECCLKSLNMPNCSGVVINGFTCYAVYKAIENANLKPILIDINKDNLNFTAANLEKEIKKNNQIKIVIIQNTLGYPCDIENIYKICKKNNLILIEDLAHSIGSKYLNSKESGSFGDFIVLSFSQDKIVDAVSGGALIIKNDNFKTNFINYKKINLTTQIKDRLYPYFTFKIRFLYGLGLGKIYHWILKNLNLLSKPMDDKDNISILPNWYKSLIYDAFKSLESTLLHRKRVSKVYSENISDELLIKKVVENINYSTNLRFPILIENRNKVVEKLKKNGIHLSDIWYDAPIAPKRYMRNVSYKNDCPNSEFISERILNLPTHININEKEAIKISEIINKVCKLRL